MNEFSGSGPTRKRSARWIGAGFIGAFAASIGTVIYTGLNVEGSRAEYDADFRQLTMSVGEARRIDLVFESPAAFDAANLEIALPEVVRLAGGAGDDATRRAVSLSAGENLVSVEVEATAAGRGFLEARVTADEPIRIERVYLTVTAD
jgi:hypothetical protein